MTYSTNSTQYVVNLSIQPANRFGFSEWINLLTLCLAPLIAHIVAGVPSPSYLDASRPKWYERAVHYNPTSIIWRYAMIANRRIRCDSAMWRMNKQIIGATNALFWTARGWDGSENMIYTSSEHRVHLPENTRVPIFSSEMLNTSIVTLQGIQALYTIVSGLTGKSTSISTLNSLALDTIFFPLAVMGLLRVFCAFWLRSDYEYSDKSKLAGSSSEMGVLGQVVVDATDGKGHYAQPILETQTIHFHEPLELRRHAFWASVLFRVTFMVPLFGLCLMPTTFLVAWHGFSVTNFVLILLYLYLFTSALVIVLYYFARGHTSTVLPCIHTMWYRLYSAGLAALFLALFIVASIETRKTPCGVYTSFPDLDGDSEACVTQDVSMITLFPGQVENIGISWNSHFATSTSRGNDTTGLGRVNGTIADLGRYAMFNFTGACLGVFN